jgi:site-specific DNA recombinase
MTRAAIYCRISFDTEGRALGVARQLEDCRRIAQIRGWETSDELTYVDNNISASRYSRKARTQYLRLLGDIEAGKVDAVVIWMEDRLQRQVLEVAEFLKVCETAGVTKIASAGGEFDLSHPDQRTMLYIKAAMAEAEVEKLRARVRRQRLQVAQKGEPHSGGRRPFGFQGKVRVRDEETGVVETRPALPLRQARAEQRLIRDAVKRVLAGESLHGIARDWEQRKVRTPSGNSWSAQNIRQMLLTPAIAGWRTHNGTLIEGTWDPIVPREQWEVLKAVLQDPKRSVGKRGRPAGHELTGLVVCGLCGRRLLTDYSRRAGGRKVRIYTCHVQVAYGGCGRISRQADKVEELVRKALFRAVESPVWDEQAARRSTDDPARPHYERLTEITAELDVLDRRIGEAELAEELGRTPHPSAAALRRMLADREAEREQHQAAVTRLQHGRTMAAVPRNLREVWEKLSIDRRRAIMAAVIERIEVHPQGRDMAFDPDAIKVKPRWPGRQ